MVLYISTNDQKKVLIVLKNGSKTIASLTDYNQYGSQILLPLITKLLKQNENSQTKIRSFLASRNKIDFKDIKQIKVETGPGSFTGIRVGVSVANALGFSLNIPVNGKKIETDLEYN